MTEFEGKLDEGITYMNRYLAQHATNWQIVYTGTSLLSPLVLRSNACGCVAASLSKSAVARWDTMPDDINEDMIRELGYHESVCQAMLKGKG